MSGDYFRLALRNIFHRKVRSWLTVIGIVIGIGSIVSLLLLSSGLENAIVEQFEQSGANRLYVFPKAQIAGSFASKLTEDDASTASSVGGVEWVQQYKLRGAAVRLGREEIFISNLFSVPAEGFSERAKGVSSFQLESGRLFSSQDTFHALVGFRAAHSIFDKDIRTNSNIFIKDQKFKVIGILKETGTPDDSDVIIPEKAFTSIFPDFGNEVSFIEIKASDGVSVEDLADRIDKTLERVRDDEEFLVRTPESFLEGLTSILVVGGIGIANSMFTSVLERTREIGVMKSIGARNSTILFIFILEAGLIGFVGGSAGVIVGIGTAIGVEAIAKQSGFGLLKIIIGPGVVLFGILFAIIVGMLAGFIPAYKASRLDPVVALRG
ncbi:ABC transporter permease [Candidatus Woesearchaeota archaeon]|nr:ABC transporter permease [Candidatus Woesearchaeota archaeon]